MNLSKSEDHYPDPDVGAGFNTSGPLSPVPHIRKAQQKALQKLNGDFI